MRRIAAGLAAALALAGCDDGEHPAVAEAVELGRFARARLVALPEEHRGDPEAYLAVGRKFCPTGSNCQVLFFPPGVEVPVPPPPQALEARDGVYVSNPLTGETGLSLRCAFAEADRDTCF